MIVALKSKQVKEILARKHMSHNGFAIKLNISSGYMSQLMSGVRNPSPELRQEILMVLKMNKTEFDQIFELKV